MKFTTVLILLAANAAAQIFGGSGVGDLVNDVLGDSNQTKIVNMPSPTPPPVQKMTPPPPIVQTLVTSTVAPAPQTTPSPTPDSTPAPSPAPSSAPSSDSSPSSASTQSSASSTTSSAFQPVWSSTYTSVPDNSTAAPVSNDSADSAGGLSTTNKVIIGASIGVGVPVLALIIHVLYYAIKNRRTARRNGDDDDGFPAPFEKLSESTSDLSLHHSPGYEMRSHV